MTPPKTIRVRIAVAVLEDGTWSATGESCATDEESMQFATFTPADCPQVCYWVTADLPLPQVGEVQGRVEEAKEGD